MSGIVRGGQQVLREAFFGKKAAPATPAAVNEPQAQKPRTATPDETSTALRRRRGSRTLLSQERMDAEAGLAGEQTTLGGM